MNIELGDTQLCVGYGLNKENNLPPRSIGSESGCGCMRLFNLKQDKPIGGF